jgi:formate-dependent nitrite reductase membrane component NrfD
MLCVFIASNKGHIEAEKIATLLFFIGEHVFLAIIYWHLWEHYPKDEYIPSDRQPVRSLLGWNLVLGVIASVLATVALIFEIATKDFVLSLWVSLQVEFFYSKTLPP